MAEFALVAPIFFLLVFAVIELGILFGGQNGLVAASRELARYAAPYRVATAIDANNVCDDARLGDQLTDALRLHIPGFNALHVESRQITYSWHPYPVDTAGTITYYVQLEIHVSYHFPLHVPLVGLLLDGFDNLSDNAFLLDAVEQMRIENDALDATFSPVTCTV